MRTKSAIRNSIFSIIQKIVEALLAFIYRTIFIQILGITYLGVNGLFTDIFSVMSLMELGVSSSIVFLLYKPLAQNNIEEVKTYMRFYANMYKIIAIAITVIGIALIPFLPYIVKTDIPDIVPIYILTLLGTVATYVFAYKRSIIEADQKAYYNSINYSIFNIINTIARIIVLLITKNFLLCLGVTVVTSLLANVEISIRANKLYPYLKDKNVKKLTKEQRNEIIKRMKAIMMHKIGNIVINSTDNIIISTFISITTVGLFSNYSLIINLIYTTVSLIFVSITSSVGNLKVDTTSEYSEIVYNRILLLNFFMYFIICTTLWCVFNQFISVWIGDEYILSPLIVGLVITKLYVTGMRNTPVTFINSSGLNYNSRFKPIAEALINLIISIIGVKILGLAGVIIGTILSYILCSVWIEPVILYKYWFKKRATQYFIKYCYFALITIIFAVAVNCICSKIVINGWAGIIVKSMVAVVMSLVIFILLFFKTEEFKYYVSMVKQIISNVTKKIKEKKKREYNEKRIS